MWACTRPHQSVYAAAELVCRRRVVVLVSVKNTAAVGRVTLPHNSFASKSYTGIIYQV